MKRFLAFFACAALLLMQGCHPDPVLTVNPQSLTFNQDGGTETIHVTANYPWTALVNGTGLTISPMSGEGDATVTVTAAAASSTVETKGTITFRSEELSASVTVSQEAKSMITVGSTSKIPAEGGTFTVDIQYNTNFSVDVEAGAQSWIAFNGTKAVSSGKLVFLFAANGNTEPRTGKVTVTDKGGRVAPITLTFEQEEKKVIELGEDIVTVPAAGGPVEVDVQYNTDIVVDIPSSAQNWVTFIQTKALTSGKLEFLIAANEYTDPRSTTVTVKDKSGKASPRSLTFIQEEKKLIQADEGFRIPEQGGTYLLNVWYNVDFNVEVEPAAQSWITFVQTKSLTAGQLEFYFAANDGEERTGHVYLKDKAGDLSPVTITFVQDKISKATVARQIMERVYEAWGAREWKNRPWIPGVDMPGYWFDPETETVTFYTNDYGIDR
ncbi:MAG: BACON domain-containing protein, partial [Bacteroidales bacterium]|nr:BACON domain-containing protein [Bacteroidales bacterium]